MTSPQRVIRIALMGFGSTGRKLYEIAAASDDIQVVAIADIGRPEILHYLLQSESKTPEHYSLDGNYLRTAKFNTRMMQIDHPAETPWDLFDVDMVIDATGRYRTGDHMADHLSNGANRVLIRTLPVDQIDRIVVPGVNEQTITASDRMISAGSGTTSALALLLKTVSDKYQIECSSMTSVHAYTSDQALQDYAGSDFRRSRSAAVNIIPNTHEASLWLGEILPQFEGKVITSALNVPIHEGSMLDCNLIMKDSSVTADDINQLMKGAAAAHPRLIAATEDPIVSSDVIGSPYSLLFDTDATIKAGSHTIKTLSWYENFGHAHRMLDVARLYAALDDAEQATRSPV